MSPRGIPHTYSCKSKSCFPGRADSFGCRVQCDLGGLRRSLTFREGGLIDLFSQLLYTSCRVFYCLACETQQAFKGKRCTLTNTKNANEMGDGVAGCVKRRWKGNIEKQKEGRVTTTFPPWCIAFAASPMVRLFVICQSPSNVELRESKPLWLARPVLTLTNIEEWELNRPPVTCISKWYWTAFVGTRKAEMAAKEQKVNRGMLV